MALFFDKDWFDARLKAVHLTRRDLAAALGLSETQVDEVWKDQRELSAREVAVLSGLLNAPTNEIANHAGVSTPVPKEATDVGREIHALKKRLDHVERMLSDVVAALKKNAP
jgi:transcriptional regulator with XRE-family HTH domain